MIAHQAMGENINLPFLAVSAQPFEIALTIFFTKKHVLSSITALRNMMGDI